MIIPWRLLISTVCLMRRRTSASVWPELVRNFWESASFGNDCFFCWSKVVRTSLSLATILRFAVSCKRHCDEIRNCIVVWLAWSYSCLHWTLSVFGSGFGTPFCAGCLAFAATHFVKSGGSGITMSAGFWPVLCACCLIVAVSQWAYCSLVILASPTVATESDGTSSPPQPAMTRITAASAARSERGRKRLGMEDCLIAGSKASLSACRKYP